MGRKRFKTKAEIEAAQYGLMKVCYKAIKKNGPMTADELILELKSKGWRHIPSINQLCGDLRRNGWVGQNYETQSDKSVRQITWYIREDED